MVSVESMALKINGLVKNGGLESAFHKLSQM